MIKIIDKFIPKNKRIGLFACILSLIGTVITAYIHTKFLYERLPVYEELVLGYTTWNGYYKQGDMTLAYHVIFGIVIFYFIFSFILNLFCEKTEWLKETVNENHIAYRQKEKFSEISGLFYLIIVSQFAFVLILRGITILIPSIYETIKIISPFLQILLLFFVFVLKFRENKALNSLLFVSQLLLPLVFLLIFYYEYDYQGHIIIQYQSKKAFVLAAVLSFFMILYMFYKKRKAPDTKIFVTTFLSLAVFASYHIPKGTISGEAVEFYHYGELSVPLHQLMKFGTIPYIDTMPIHGICDYFQAIVWYGLFDGTYASFEAAMVIGCVVIAVITAAICFYFVESKIAGLLIVLFFSLFGDQYYYVRWAFALPFILIVFSKKSRSDFSKMLWYWIFISILSIAWNPSIGGTCALSMLPMILWEGFHEKGYLQFVRIWKNKNREKRWILAYIFLLILGFSFIPMFFAILRYIVENSAAILETTGDMLMVELENPFVVFATFGFVIPLLLSFYYIIGKKGEEKKLAVYANLFLLIFNSIIVKYTFVRTQFGERGIIATTICSLFFILMVLVPNVKKNWDKESLIILAALFMITIGSKGANLFTMPQNVLYRGIVENEYEYVEGEKIGIPSLGNIYMKKDLKEELVSLNHLANELCKDKYQFVDMTNQLAHYNILDKKVLLPFSSTYNTNNEVMQKKAIEVLSELQPEVIVVGPMWGHDSGPLSTRNYHLYQWIIKNEYVPCKYNNILFLTNEENIWTNYESAYDEMAVYMEVDDWKKVPLMWGNDLIEEKYTKDVSASIQLIDYNSILISENVYQVLGADTYFLFSLEEPLNGKDVDFLRIYVGPEESAEQFSYKGTVSISEEDHMEEELVFKYSGKAKEILLPLSTNPRWSYAEKNKIIKIDLSGEQLIGKQIKMEIAFEKYVGIGNNK